MTQVRRRRFTSWLIALPLLALLALLHNNPDPPPRHQAEWLDAGGTRLRTLRTGRGDTTLLLLHGYGESLTTWRAVVDPLAEVARVIAVDLPGFGCSEKPDTTYTLEAITERMSRFLDAWTEGPVVVVGHSMGGEVAASLAMARPDRIKAVILIAPAGFRIGLAGLADTMYPSKAAMLGRYLGLRSFITPIHDPAWLGEPDSMAGYDLTLDPAFRRSAARVLEDFDFTGLRDRFDELTQPTLLIWGGNDPVVPYSVADSVAGLIPCARLETLETAFHRPHAELPETVLRVIRRFLAEPARC